MPKGNLSIRLVFVVVFSILAAVQLMRFYFSKHVDDVCSTNAIPQKQAEMFFFDCGNIHEIKVSQLLGHGWRKSVYLAKHGEVPVVIKVPRFDSKCMAIENHPEISHNHRHTYCSSEAIMLLMREVYYLQVLKHPNIVRLLGSCIRGEKVTNDSNIYRHDIAVFEFAHIFQIEKALTKTWRRKLSLVRQFVHILDYLEHSPMGSMRFRDMTANQFMLIRSRIMVTDLDSLTSLEPSCGTTDNSTMELKPCHLGVACENGICEGFNAKYNMVKLYDLYLKQLLEPGNVPSSKKEDVRKIHILFEALAIDAHTLLIRLDDL